MSFSDLSAIGSLISGVAVAASLVYLALQVRQSDRNQRAAIIQGRTAMGIEAMFHVAEPHNAGLIAKMQEDPASLTLAEFTQHVSTMRALWLWFEDAHFHHNASLLDGLAFEGFLTGIKGALTQRQNRVFWKLYRNSFSPNFRAFVDELIKTVPMVPVQNLFQVWKDEMAAIGAMPGVVQSATATAATQVYI